jgi:hypothetical protein
MQMCMCLIVWLRGLDSAWEWTTAPEVSSSVLKSEACAKRDDSSPKAHVVWRMRVWVGGLQQKQERSAYTWIGAELETQNG